MRIVPEFQTYRVQVSDARIQFVGIRRQECDLLGVVALALFAPMPWLKASA
jgi:hypothetical protein